MSTLPDSLATLGDDAALRSAMGALKLRKRCYRKKTPTGEYVWSDLADVSLSLGLIIWTASQAHRVGTKRCVFLREFLQSRGIHKTRKQISSRLQVLKGEWRNTPYEELLRHPQDLPGGCCQTNETSSPRQDPGVSENVREQPPGNPSQGTMTSSFVIAPSAPSDAPEYPEPEISPCKLEYHRAPDPLPNSTTPHTDWGCSSSLPPITFGSDPQLQGPSYTSAVPPYTAYDDPTLSGYYYTHPSSDFNTAEASGFRSSYYTDRPTSSLAQDGSHSDRIGLMRRSLHNA